MSIANRRFELQPSRFSIMAQLFIFLLILILIFQLLSIWITLISAVVMGLGWLLFFKQPKIKSFEYLDGQDWSFEFVALSSMIQRRKITTIIDHQCYIVLYFSHSQHKPCVIWWDQLSVPQWKNLKLLVKLL